MEEGGTEEAGYRSAPRLWRRDRRASSVCLLCVCVIFGHRFLSQVPLRILWKFDVGLEWQLRNIHILTADVCARHIHSDSCCTKYMHSDSCYTARDDWPSAICVTLLACVIVFRAAQITSNRSLSTRCGTYYDARCSARCSTRCSMARCNTRAVDPSVRQCTVQPQCIHAAVCTKPIPHYTRQTHV